MQESDPSALAMLRWKFVVQKYTHPPHRISLAFPNPGIRMDRRRAALLLILIWSYIPWRSLVHPCSDGATMIL